MLNPVGLISNNRTLKKMALKECVRNCILILVNVMYSVCMSDLLITYKSVNA